MNLRAYDIDGQTVNLITEFEKLIEQKNFEDALSCMRICLEAEPENPEFQHNVGFCLSELGQHARALPHFERADKESGGKHKYAINLGICLMHLNRDSSALPILERARNGDVSNPQYLTCLALCQARLQMPEAAGNLRIAFRDAKAQKGKDNDQLKQTIEHYAEMYGFTL